MDAKQLENRLEWLDGVQRKWAEETERLSERIAGLETLIEQEQEQREAIASDIARLSTQATRMNQFDEALHKHRLEVARQLEMAEERRANREKELEELRKMDQKATAKAFDDVRDELAQLSEIERLLTARQEEELRIAQEIAAIRKSLQDTERLSSDRERKMARFEEGRQQDAKRVRVVQKEVTKTQKEINALKGKLDLHKDQLTKNEARIAEFLSAVQNMRDDLSLWEQKQGLKIVEFEKAWKAWEKRFLAFEKRADSVEERIHQYEETYRSVRQLQSDLKEMLDKLDRRISEVGEMQRLSEERLQGELKSFQVGDLKRWDTFTLGQEERWREYERSQQSAIERVEALEGEAESLRNTAELLMGRDAERLQQLLALLREWAADHSAKGKRR